MGDAGLSKSRLGRMHRVLSGHIERKDMPGLVALVSHNDDVHVETLGIFHTPGRFGWTGGFGTTAYTDPAEGMIGILFTQRMMDSPEPAKVFTDFWTLAYGAME
jgi:CubicO group peptidase (beta-lactamase class C family)